MTPCCEVLTKVKVKFQGQGHQKVTRFFFHKNYLRIPKFREVMPKSRLFEGEMPHIFIVMVALQNIVIYSPRSNSVEGQMSKSFDGQIPQIANSYYLCMVICCEGQGYIARPVERS